MRYTTESYLNLQKFIRGDRKHFLSRHIEIMKINKAITQEREKYKSKQISLEEYRRVRSELKEDRSRKVKTILSQYSEKISDRFNKKDIEWGLEKSFKLNGREIFKIHDEGYLKVAEMECRNEILTVSNYRSISRDNAIKLLIDALDNKASKFIIRLDIKKFYDSIDHEILLKKISSMDLSSITEYLVKSLLEEYKTITGKSKGVPQGIPLSSVLADIYLEDLDKDIRKIESVVYYNRYVDDIFIVQYKDRGDINQEDHVANRVFKHFREKNLEYHNSNKFLMSFSHDIEEIEYLGYKIHISDSGVAKILMSDEKLNRYKKSIDLAFEVWYKKILKFDDGSIYPDIHGEKFNLDLYYKYRAVPDGLLVSRLEFLTLNKRMQNSKKDILVGLQANNRFLTTDIVDGSLRKLDEYLKNKLKRMAKQRNKSGMHRELEKKIIEKVQFESNFKNKKFRNYKSKNIKYITEIWKYVK